MPQVGIRKIDANGTLPGKGLIARIRERAFEIFQHRDETAGSALEDWLKAEQEFGAASESELVENNGAFEFQVPVPGFTAKEVEVLVAPGEVTVRAEHSREEDFKQGDAFVNTSTEEKLFRSFSLPAPINTDKVTAILKDGVLKLSAVKAA